MAGVVREDLCVQVAFEWDLQGVRPAGGEWVYAHLGRAFWVERIASTEVLEWNLARRVWGTGRRRSGWGMRGARTRSEWASSLAFTSVMWEATGRSWAGERHDLTYISGLSLPIMDDDCSHEIKRRVLLGRKTMTNLDSILKSRDITLPAKVRLIKAVVFPGVMYKCENWTIKKAAFELWCWRRFLRVPWTARRSNQSILQNQSWIFTGRTDAEAKALILWPPDVKSWLIGKDPGARRDWGQEEKGMTEDEMVGWHHQFNGHEFKQAPGDGEGQGSPVCLSPWGCKESDTTELLNDNIISNPKYSLLKHQ